MVTIPRPAIQIIAVHAFIDARLVEFRAFTVRSVIACRAQRSKVSRIERAVRRNAYRLDVIDASDPVAADISAASNAAMSVTD
jgi:hypothetical protein